MAKTALASGLALTLPALLSAAPPAGSRVLPGPSWSSFRGGPANLGTAAGPLPEKPELLWSYKTGGPVKSSAVIHRGSVFVGAEDGHLYALDAANGTKRWTFDAASPIEAPPLALDGAIYVGSHDGVFYAIDAGSGEARWEYETAGKIIGGATWAVINQKAHIIFGSHDSHLYCVKSTTGELLWTYETNNYVNATPAVDDGTVVVGGCDGFLHILSVTDGEPVQQINLGSYVANAAAVHGRRAYLGHYGNEFVCVDLVGGIEEPTCWEYDGGGFAFFSAPAIAGRRVVFGGRDRRLHCVAIEDGAPLWTFTTRGSVDSSPVICGDKVAVGSEDGRLYLVRLSDGQEVWSYNMGGAIIASPAVAGGLIVIGSEDGRVYAFGEGE